MIRVNRLRLDCGSCKEDIRSHITESGKPFFSWGVIASRKNARQGACRVRVWNESDMLWDSGWIAKEEQRVQYAGSSLPLERRVSFSVSVRDDAGQTSDASESYFIVSGLHRYTPSWICAPVDKPNQAVYFRRCFSIRRGLKRATLYVCGLGYQSVTLNGNPVDDAVLDPAFSDYTKTIYYVMHPELETRLTEGLNCIGVILGEGWRRNEGPYLQCIGERKIDFFGTPQLSAVLSLEYADGSRETIDVDENWQCTTDGPIVYNHLFNGEALDMRRDMPGWDTAAAHTDGFIPAKKIDSPGGCIATMVLEPIREQEIYMAKTVTTLGEGSYIVDFGQNIAGVCSLRLPQNLLLDQRITIDHMEFLDEDGALYLPNLRGARCQDTYIAAGDERDLAYWQPRFTYHGFRYAHIRGLSLLEPEDITAVSLYTDISQRSFFRCGSALVNAIQHTIVQTEKSNIHSILTDCPQRDERMGWMNDATVRFEETPYNFDIGRLFPKVLRDVADTQEQDGSITCTAPRVYGERPADPVCSSYLIAGMQALLFTGNLAAIRRTYDGFAQWEACLLSHSENYIVRYSHYGDWAAPVYACKNGDTDLDATVSLYMPGDLISTGYSYYNTVLLAKFAALLERNEDVRRYEEQAGNIRNAMLAKWWDGSTGRMANGSMSCQCFALWLGILPEEKHQLAASVMREDLLTRQGRFTTGNLCTRYLFDMLAEYGYIDDAWELIMRETYPSIGYMLQLEATTVWERFELKKSSGMNSHNHPMYASIGSWFYAYIAGIKPRAPGFQQVDIRPYFPQKLLSAYALVETIMGDLTVRWVKRYGRLYLYVDIPFGTQADVYLDGQCHHIGSGFWSWDCEIPSV